MLCISRERVHEADGKTVIENEMRKVKPENLKQSTQFTCAYSKMWAPWHFTFFVIDIQIGSGTNAK